MKNGSELYQKKHCITTTIRQYSQLEMISAKIKLFTQIICENKSTKYCNDTWELNNIVNGSKGNYSNIFPSKSVSDYSR